MKTANMERMGRFLNDLQGTFMENGWSYVLPRVSSSLGEDDEPDDRVIDAHWREKEFELLLTLDEGLFIFYGDDYGKRKINKADATPKDVADAIRLLRSA